VIITDLFGKICVHSKVSQILLLIITNILLMFIKRQLYVLCTSTVRNCLHFANHHAACMASTCDNPWLVAAWHPYYCDIAWSTHECPKWWFWQPLSTDP